MRDGSAKIRIAGTDKEKKGCIQKKIEAVGGILETKVLINLKNCITNTAEHIEEEIREHLKRAMVGWEEVKQTKLSRVNRR